MCNVASTSVVSAQTQLSCILLLRSDMAAAVNTNSQSLTGSKFESLKNVNVRTAKFAQWIVRILDPKVIEYTFLARGEEVQAKKFQCILVSENNKEYLPGVVPFSFSDPNAATDAAAKYVNKSVWIMKKPTFDSRAKPQYYSSSVSGQLLLNSPTDMQRVADTTQGQSLTALPSESLDVGLDLKGIMNALAVVKKPAGGQQNATNVDLCGKVLSITEMKDVVKNGKKLKVSELCLADQSGGKIDISVWNQANAYLQNQSLTVRRGMGLMLLGVGAVKVDGKVKLNMWEHVAVITDGKKIQSLTEVELDEGKLENLTSTFSPQASQPDVSHVLTASGVMPTVCVALALTSKSLTGASDALDMGTQSLTGGLEDKIFQANRCLFDFLTDEATLFTSEGQLRVVMGKMYDCTGQCDVYLCSQAVLALCGCKDEAQLRSKVQSAAGVEAVKHRNNVRGFVRSDDSRKFIVQVMPTPLSGRVSSKAVTLLRGMAPLEGGGVIPTPVSFLQATSLQGLCVVVPGQDPMPVYRVWLVVKGTEASTLDTLSDNLKLEEQTYKITSKSVECQLTSMPGLASVFPASFEKKCHVTLEGYCSFKDMLTFRLDEDAALVLVSSISMPVSDSKDQEPVLVVEHMQKPGPDLEAVKHSCVAEFHAACELNLEIFGDDLSEVFLEDPRPFKKLKTLASEAATPLKEEITQSHAS